MLMKQLIQLWIIRVIRNAFVVHNAFEKLLLHDRFFYDWKLKTMLFLIYLFSLKKCQNELFWYHSIELYLIKKNILFKVKNYPNRAI